LGSTELFATHGLSRNSLNTNAVFTDGYVYYDAVYVEYDVTLTGIGFLQITQGSYTADNYNGVGLYSYNGSGTWTLVASSTDDGNIWKGAANTIQKKAFTTPYAATTGIYLVASMYNSSAQTTAPSIAFFNSITSSAGFVNDFTNSAKSCAFNSGPLTALPTPTVLTTAMTQNTQQRYFFLY